MLNYETDAMTRDEIVAATYESMRRLTLLKREWNLEDEAKTQASLDKINSSAAAVFAVDEALRLPEGAERETAVQAATMSQAESAAIFQKKYLVWPLISGRRFASLASLAAVGLGLLWTEVRLFATKRFPLYWSDRRSVRRGSVFEPAQLAISVSESSVPPPHPTPKSPE